MKRCGQISANPSVKGRLVALLFAIVLGSAPVHAQDLAYRFTRVIGGDGHDNARAVAADDAGNTYIAGHFERTVDFDPGAGTATLTSSDSPITPAGNDCFVASYDVNGNYRWAFQIGGLGGDGAIDIAVDPSGNIVVLGNYGSTADFDPGPGLAMLNGGGNFVAKYTPAGAYLWAFRLSVNARAIAIDGLGNIGVTGDFVGTVDFNPGTRTNNLSNSGRFIAVYSPSGQYNWALRIGALVITTQPIPLMYGIDFDNSGNVVVSGYYNGKVYLNPAKPTSYLASPDGATFFAKYSSRGKYLWGSQLQTIMLSGGSLAVDGGDNIILTGNFGGTVDFNTGAGTNNLTSAGNDDIYVARFNSAGVYQWAFRVGSSVQDASHSIVIDASNSIYITGTIFATVDFDPGAGVTEVVVGGGTAAYFIARYSSAGGFLWASGSGHGATTNNLAFTGSHIAVDGDDNVHMARSFNGTGDFDPGDAVETLSSVPHVDGGPSGDAFLARYDHVIMPKPVTPTASFSDDRTLHVAPNPFTGGFNLRSDQPSVRSQIYIIDVMGRVVETSEVGDGDDEVLLGSELPVGTYLVEIVRGSERRHKLVHKVR